MERESVGIRPGVEIGNGNMGTELTQVKSSRAGPRPPCCVPWCTAPAAACNSRRGGCCRGWPGGRQSAASAQLPLRCGSQESPPGGSVALEAE